MVYVPNVRAHNGGALTSTWLDSQNRISYGRGVLTTESRGVLGVDYAGRNAEGLDTYRVRVHNGAAYRLTADKDGWLPAMSTGGATDPWFHINVKERVVYLTRGEDRGTAPADPKDVPQIDRPDSGSGKVAFWAAQFQGMGAPFALVSRLPGAEVPASNAAAQAIDKQVTADFVKSQGQAPTSGATPMAVRLGQHAQRSRSDE
ncbi:MAG: hypothetical protein AB2A00_24965 [Myxococcota bacterium]